MSNKNFIYGDLYAAQSGGTIYSAGTALELIFAANYASGGTSGNLWSASTGTNSIIANNGSGNEATNNRALAGGFSTLASGDTSVSWGINTTAGGQASFAEGRDSVASGSYSHAEGVDTTASGQASHSEGYGSSAPGDEAHAEGNQTTAGGNYSHSEGFQTFASGIASHAEGATTTASGVVSHAEGEQTIASGSTSHSQGVWTIAGGNSSHVGGRGFDQFGRLTSNGEASFAHFLVNYSPSNFGAYADHSAILGGLNHNIASGADNSAILGGSGNIINSGVTGSVILGGTNITGTSNNTVYVPKLNISNISTGTSITQLGVDSGGYVVSSSPYLEYRANLTQTGTTAPSDSVFGVDGIGGVWSYQDIGVYYYQKVGAFSASTKVEVNIAPGDVLSYIMSNDAFWTVSANRISDDVIEVRTAKWTTVVEGTSLVLAPPGAATVSDAMANNGLTNKFISIKIWS